VLHENYSLTLVALNVFPPFPGCTCTKRNRGSVQTVDRSYLWTTYWKCYAAQT